MSNQRVITNKKLDQSFWGYVKRQFRKNKLAVFSLYFAFFLALIALFADFLANDKPLIAKYEGKIYFPVMQNYLVNAGLSSWPQYFQGIDWHKIDFEMVVYPPVPYTPQHIDYNNQNFVGPFDSQVISSNRWRHWLGTDNLGRDVMAGMIHGTRIAFLVGIIAMSIASVIGVFFGAMAGYFGDSKLKASRISLLLLIAGIFLGLFYGFGVRSYTLSDAISQSYGAFIFELFLSIFIVLGIIVASYFIAKPFKKIRFLAKEIAIPVDIMVSRLIEIIVSIPTLFLIISIIAIAQPSILLVMAIIGLVSWTGIARFIRAEILRVRSLEYIEASHALGYSEARTILRHVIPNSLSPVLIAIAFGIAAAILTESTLSFLGIGVSADTVTWGSLLSDARRAADAWWLAIFPGFAIFITVTIFNLIGEGLTDALDPRLKQ